MEAHPRTRHVMLGRGLLANSASCACSPAARLRARTELRQFHDKLYAAYLDEIGGNAVFRMKEWWFYAKCAFADPMAVHRAVRKARKVEEYETAVEVCFDRASGSGRFHG